MPDLRIKDLPATERPREKLDLRGPGALSDAELIAILFGKGTVGANAVEMGRALLAECGSLYSVARCNPKQLEEIKGIGPAKALTLAAAFELGHRLAGEKIRDAPLDNPEAIYDLLGRAMSAATQETLHVVLLNTRFRLIRACEVFRGSLNESLAHPREILKPAVLHSAYGLVLVHNHPSGDPGPSEADRDLTRRLASLCSEMQIEFVDHIVIGRPAHGREPFFSFKEAGLL